MPSGLNCFLNVSAELALLGLAQLDVEHLHKELDGAALQVWGKKKLSFVTFGKHEKCHNTGRFRGDRECDCECDFDQRKVFGN